MIPRDVERTEPSSLATESRAYPRVKVHSLAYIELGEANAGLILNISETGIAIQAVEILSPSYFPRMQFRLPKTEAPIQVAGKLIWQIKPRKVAGIEFEGLSEQTRLAIRKWIAGEENRQSESEKAHLKPLSDLPGSARQKTAVQVYPSERGDEETVAVIPDVPSPPAEFAPAHEISQADTGALPAAARSVFEPRPSIVPPCAPMRVPDRWRAEPHGLPRNAAQSPAPGRPGQIFPTSAWNRGGIITPIDQKNRRPWWPYMTAIALLAAVGIAGVMALDPGAISIAGALAVVDRITPTLKNYQPPQSSSAANTPPASSATQGANAASPSPASPAPSLPQPEPPTNALSNTPSTAQASAPAASPSGVQDGTQLNASGASTAPDTNGVAAHQSNPVAQPPANSAPAPANGASSEVPHDAAEPPSPAPSAVPAGTAPYSRGTSTTETRSSQAIVPKPPVSGSQNRAPARRPRSNQSALDAWRAQTEPPARTNAAANSTARSRNRVPATQQYEVQDAYARSAPYVARGANNTPQNSAAPPQSALVDMAGYPTAAVAPSTPLAGVPSGSVATTSQLRAIWVPASLAWARQYLPGNLGAGQLLSSYSPAYPIGAARDGIEGTVKLDVTIATDGTVRAVRVLSGPPVLSSAAVSAVRDWRYAETFLAGDAIETQQYVTMVFRLTPTR